MTTKVPPSHWMTAREQTCDAALLGTGSPLDLSDGGPDDWNHY